MHVEARRAGTPAIQAEGLRKTYPRGVEALRGIGFEAERGAVFALLGPNGAGKSTTVKILTTLTRPDAGTVRVAGIDAIRDPASVRRVIGVVSQRTAVDPEATGAENLRLHAHLQRVPGRELDGRVRELLARFDLTDAAGRIVKTWSGGMQRRLDLALGLVHRPQVLFLDEPTTGLDPEARAAIWDEVARLTEEDGVTVLLTTHYLEEADRLARHVAIVDEGRIVAAGAPAELKRDLQGDAVRLELGADAPLAAAAATFARLDGLVRDPRLDGRTAHARVADGPRALPAILAAFEEARVPVTAATLAGPSLDDVYLRHTGKSLRATSEGAPA
jgi:ABC-2 type transport system ATP-binding protein